MKLLFTDIDGTLLNTDKTISSKLRAGILSFIAAGNKFVLCSGRPEKSIMQVKSALCLPNQNIYLSSCNGARLFDCENEQVLSETGIPLPLVREVLDAAYSFSLHCHTYDEDSILSEYQTKELDYYTSHINMPTQILPDIASHLKKEPLKMLSVSLDTPSQFPSFQKTITNLSNGSLTSLLSNPNYLEIFASSAGKGSSIRKLTTYLSASFEDTIAVGDAANDISMIQAAHFGVAMQNADSATKKHADYITKNDNNHDGLFEILKQYCN